MPSVLIVDDSDQMRRMIRSIIEPVADPIYECPDGADALAACVRHQPDCVLMDIEMPTTDGISATRANHCRPAFDADLHRALTTTTERLRLAAEQAGASGYVLKENLLALRPLLEALV